MMMNMIRPTTRLFPATMSAKACTISLWSERWATPDLTGCTRIFLVEEMFMAAPKRVIKRTSLGNEVKSADLFKYTTVRRTINERARLRTIAISMAVFPSGMNMNSAIRTIMTATKLPETTLMNALPEFRFSGIESPPLT